MTTERKPVPGIDPPPTVTIGPGYKFPVLFEVVRAVKDGELVPDVADPTKMVPASNPHGYLFWVRNPYFPEKEWPMCFWIPMNDPQIVVRDQAVVEMIEGSGAHVPFLDYRKSMSLDEARKALNYIQTVILRSSDKI